MTIYKAILPQPAKDSEQFWAGCNEGKLLLCDCRHCGNLFYYPRLMCTRCGSRELGWRESAGKGKVFSFTHVHTSFFGDTWQSELPYTLVLVDLDEGPRMLSRLIGERCDAVRTGDPVKVSFATVESQKLPYFELLRGE